MDPLAKSRKRPANKKLKGDKRSAKNIDRSPLAQAGMTISVGGTALTIDDLVRVSRRNARVEMTNDKAILDRIDASCRYIENAVASGESIYGVTSGFGGMAHVRIDARDAAALQNNLIWHLNAGAGNQLPVEDVRASMLLRANSHLHGASGIRLVIIRRIETFLNARVTPHVREFGSIGASGDLVPLAQITGALTGAGANFMVDFDGKEMDCLQALEILGLPRLRLQAKEGLAMVNGTSVMTGIAANCVHAARVLLALALGTHALMIQALSGTNQSFHPFIHNLKPHPGQQWAAAQMLRLLQGSQFIRNELDGKHDWRDGDLIQDRYSLRCLPQYFGPIVDGLRQVSEQIEVEMNSATDNPLIDSSTGVSYHGGNFLGQYVGVAMDQLRYHLSLLAKHLDVQIASLVSPAFNNGLPGSLVGNVAKKINMGTKGLQLCANSMMPLLSFYGNSLVPHFPTHAEQFNQNINSMGFGSANLARQTIRIFEQYMAVSLMVAVQAIDLRAYQKSGSYDARSFLSPGTLALYEAVRQVVGKPASNDQSYLWNDADQALDLHIAKLAADITAGGLLPLAVAELMGSAN